MPALASLPSCLACRPAAAICYTCYACGRAAAVEHLCLAWMQPLTMGLGVKTPPSGDFRLCIPGTEIYPLASSVFRFAMSIVVKTSFSRAISSLVYRPVPSVFALFNRQIFDTFSIFAACYCREAIFGKIETTQFLGILTVPVAMPLSVFRWRSYFSSY